VDKWICYAGTGRFEVHSPQRPVRTKQGLFLFFLAATFIPESWFYTIVSIFLQPWLMLSIIIYDVPKNVTVVAVMTMAYKGGFGEYDVRPNRRDSCKIKQNNKHSLHF